MPPPGPIVTVLLANLALACYGPMVVHYGTGAINNAANMFFSYALMSAIVLLARSLKNPAEAQRIWGTVIHPDMLWSALINFFRLLLLFVSLNAGMPGISYACYMMFPIVVLIQQAAHMKGIPSAIISKGTTAGAIVAFFGVLTLVMGPMLLKYEKTKQFDVKAAFHAPLPALGAAVLMAFMLYFLKKVDAARGTIKTNKGFVVSPVEQVLGIFLFPMALMGIFAVLYNKTKVGNDLFNKLQLGGIGADTKGDEFMNRNVRMMLFNVIFGFTAYFLLFYGLKYLSTLQVSVLSNSLPIFGFLVGFALIHGFYRGEHIPWPKISIKIAGIAIIVVGTILVAYYHRKKIVVKEVVSSAVSSAASDLQSNGTATTMESEFGSVRDVMSM
jgi:drug/metabolite transporter (DMT)-like permease